MRVPNWTDEVIAEKVNKQFVANTHIFPVQIDGELTEYGNFVLEIAKLMINSLDHIPGGFLLKMFLTEETLSALVSIIGGAFTAGILAERAGWFKEPGWKSHEEFSEKLDKFSKS